MKRREVVSYWREFMAGSGDVLTESSAPPKNSTKGKSMPSKQRIRKRKNSEPLIFEELFSR